jgi:integrase
MVSVPEREPIFYTKTDFLRLIATIKEDWLRSVVIFSAHTGMRQGEILLLKWSQIDLDRRMINIESNKGFRTKAGRRRTIPINNTVCHLLRSKMEIKKTDYVFTLNGDVINRRWVGEKLRRYVRQLGLNRKLNFHSLRHSFASWLAMDGVSIYQISKLLGHSDVSVTQDFYAHYGML